MTVTAEADGGRRRRWLVPTLVTALMVNLFVVGLLIGDRYGQRRDERVTRHIAHRDARLMQGPAEPAPSLPMAGAPGLAVPGAMREALGRLPDAERRLLVEAFMRQRQEARRLREEAVRARLASADLLSADSVDTRAFAESLELVRRTMAAQQAVGHKVLLEAASTLSHESRRQLAEGLRGPPREHRR
jgi:uncharacterized membrane protein